MMTPVQHVASLAAIENRQPTYLAIGSFDGVHLGHQQLLKSLVDAAHGAGARAAAMTFFPHPRRVVANLSGPYYLATLAQRQAWLAALGLDLIITHPFDAEVRRLSADAFVDQLIEHVDIRQLWGGAFSLGYQREGDAHFLRQTGARRGFEVVVFRDVAYYAERPVSSSRIRAALANGDMAEVTGCLGRPYQIIGDVVEGDKRGRTIGFPTANVAAWSEQTLPAHGVYATVATLNGRRYPAATNIGVRPTVDGQRLTIEAHLIDFTGDFYGESLTLDFISRQRPEQKFDGLDALVAQIGADVAAIRQELTPTP